MSSSDSEAFNALLDAHGLKELPRAIAGTPITDALVPLLDHMLTRIANLDDPLRKGE